MTEEPALSAPSDCGYVNLRSGPERRYWAKELGCSEQQLIEAVTAVGPLVVEVKRHLGMRLGSSGGSSDLPRSGNPTT